MFLSNVCFLIPGLTEDPTVLFTIMLSRVLSILHCSLRQLSHCAFFCMTLIFLKGIVQCGIYLLRVFLLLSFHSLSLGIMLKVITEWCSISMLISGVHNVHTYILLVMLTFILWLRWFLTGFCTVKLLSEERDI